MAFGWFGAGVATPGRLDAYPEIFHCFNMVAFTAVYWGFSKRLDLNYWMMVPINFGILFNLLILPFGLWLLLERWISRRNAAPAGGHEAADSALATGMMH